MHCCWHSKTNRNPRDGRHCTLSEEINLDQMLLRNEQRPLSASGSAHHDNGDGAV